MFSKQSFLANNS